MSVERVGPSSITNYYLVDAADNDKTRARKIRRTIERMSSTLLFSLTAIHGDKRTNLSVWEELEGITGLGGWEMNVIQLMPSPADDDGRIYI